MGRRLAFGENEPVILKLKQTPGIFLTGFMASGKTTIGQLLADRIGWQFADLDRDIETAEQTTISEIFAQHGEPEFRRIETEALQWRIKRIRAGGATVVALGGGTFTQEPNREMVDQHGVSIWLDCPFDVVEKRVALETHRPLALDPERFRRLYDERQVCYKQASYRIPVVDNNPSETIERIFALSIFAR